MFFGSTSIPLLNVVKDSPRTILRDMALKSDTSDINQLVTYPNLRKVHDIFNATIDKIESFIRSIVKLGILGSGIAIWYFGATTGLAIAGGIALGVTISNYLLQKKSRAIKDEYAKVYSFGWNFIRSQIEGALTFTQPLSYRLVKGLY